MYQVPNEVIISKPMNSDEASLEGFRLLDWAEVRHLSDQKKPLKVHLTSSYWTFDGTFEGRETILTIESFPSETEEFTITDLPIYPRRFASQETVRALRERGRMFWRCRERHYVQAIAQSNNSLQETVRAESLLGTLQCD
jgi:hypothetical protein